MTDSLRWTCIPGAQTVRLQYELLPRNPILIEANYITHHLGCDPFVLPVSRVDSVGRCLYPSPDLCYWSLQHVYCLYTTEEAHLVMPSLPVSICAHQRELASKIKTESKTLLCDSILSIVPKQNAPPGEGCICRKR